MSIYAILSTCFPHLATLLMLPNCTVISIVTINTFHHTATFSSWAYKNCIAITSTLHENFSNAHHYTSEII